VGLVIGVGAAIALRGIVSSFVFGVTGGDPVTYASAVLMFAAVALAAVIIPALRAARVEPVSALRAE
jgi:putative ABC transport system permease protein